MSLELDKSAWKRVKLGEVAAASKEKVDPSNGSVDRFIAGEHMDTDDLKIHRWGDPSEVDLGPAFHRRFRPGQVLYGSRRTYLRKVAVADFHGVCANTTFVVETNDPRVLLQEFLPFVMTSEPFHAFAIAESKGSVNPYVNWSDIARYEFVLPPLDEQKRIADLLWAVERERRGLVSLLNQLDGARSLMRDQLFTELSAATMPFESVCSIPSQNGVALKKSERAGNVPMVNMGEMFRDEIIASGGDYERVRPPGDGFLLNEGDLLFARRSIVFEGAGACCLVPELDQPYTFESSVIRSRVRSDLLDPRFALHFFRSARGRDVMASIVRRGPVSGIAGSDLRKLPVPIPDMTTQKRVITMVEQAGSAAPAVQLRRSAASKLGAALSADAFGGS